MKSHTAVTATTIDAATLLESIDEGRIALPDFQRDFDWSESDILELLVTVLSGWPAGSLLVMRGAPNLFRVRNLDGAPNLRSIDRVVLDGQQRLTSLYQALYDRGGSVYAIRYANFDSSSFDLEDALVWFKRAFWERNYRGLRQQLEARLVPLYALKSAPDFFEWRDAIVAEAPTSDAARLREFLGKFYRDHLSNINRYEFPVVSIDEDVEPAALARIFERVNKHGRPLNTFDLMVAKVYDPLWNLRDRWDGARRDLPEMEYFLGDDGLPVLQAIALRYKGDIRQRAVLELPRKLVHEEWDNAIISVGAALDFFADVCGVGFREWMPYRSMLLPISALILGSNLDEKIAATWFWQRGFSSFFDAAVNTRLASDYEGMEHGRLSVEAELSSTTTILEATRKRQSTTWASFLCALKSNDAVDLLSGAEFSYPIDEIRGGLEASRGRATPVSIFPRSEGDLEPPSHLRVLGLVLAEPKTAKEIRRVGLSRFCEMAAENSDAGDLNHWFGSQFLPVPAELLAMQDPLAIMRARLKLLQDFLYSGWGLEFRGDQGDEDGSP